MSFKKLQAKKQSISIPKVDTAKRLKELAATTGDARYLDAKLISADPEIVRPWALADRTSISEASIDELAQDMAKNGQLSPVLAVSIEQHQGICYHIIAGHRRWLAIRKANVDLGAALKIELTVVNPDPDRLYVVDADSGMLVSQRDDGSDIQTFLQLQETENTLRADVGYWDKGRHYQRLLDEKLFDTASDLAKEFGRAKGTVSKFLAIGSIPEDVMELIPTVHDVPLRKLYALATAYSKADARVRSETVNRMKNESPASAKEALAKLMSLLQSKPVQAKTPVAAPRRTDLGKLGRATVDGSRHRLEVRVYDALSDAQWTGLLKEFEALLARYKKDQ